MKDKILEIVSEQHSPLFRIMSGYNINEPARKSFDNNISASHIGDGYILSVAHNLRQESKIIKSINEVDYQNDIINNSNATEVILFNKCYQLDQQTNKRYLNITDKNDARLLVDVFKRINYDTRYITLYSKGICKPYLIVQFNDSDFYSDPALTALFNPVHSFPETSLNVQTFLIELELINAYWSEDIALYKVSNNTDQQIVNRLSSAEISYDLIEFSESLYCLQGSPSGNNLGRMLNESRVEGLLDHHNVIPDPIGGNIIFSGHRYLLKGYFRFGSSGAPYLIYDEELDTFKINAVQSEASPIQLSINNNKVGNFQYINAIATPLLLIQNNLSKIVNATT